MIERLRCVVPYCRRTAPPEDGCGEIMCGKHWRQLPRHQRRRYAMAVRTAKQIDERFQAQYAAQGNGYYPGQERPVVAAFDLCDKIWTRLKSTAIERAMGITA